MSLPAEAVDRLFARLAASYGAAWDRSMGTVPLGDMKAAWAHELAGFGQSRERMLCIAWALENLPERCPNVIEFRNLCRQAPAPQVPRLEAPKADPERVAQALQRLAPLRVQHDGGCTADKRWAMAILARSAAGERVGPYALMSARIAAGVAVGRGG